MDVDTPAPVTAGSANVGSTSAGEGVPSKRKVSNTASKPRAPNGSKTKPTSAHAVVNVDEEDDTETEVATLPQRKASSTKAKAPPASNQLAKPSSYSGTNGHASADSASTRRRPVSSKQAAGAHHPRRTDEEWEGILEHVWITFVQASAWRNAQAYILNRFSNRREIGRKSSKT
jgi:hypothetical protein